MAKNIAICCQQIDRKSIKTWETWPVNIKENGRKTKEKREICQR